MEKAAIFDRLVIIVHGDHGSKISQLRPSANNQHKLSRADYLDSFSTLFALKGPRHPPGYDRRVAPIEQLLGEVVGAPTGDDDMDAEKPYVFLRTGQAYAPTAPPGLRRRAAMTCREVKIVCFR